MRISLEGNVLTIQATKQEEREENTKRVHRYERMYGVFERSFTLPSSVEPKGCETFFTLLSTILA